MYYAVKSRKGNMIELRQERFRNLYEEGDEHPHDVCALARDLDELKGMIESCKLTGPFDFSQVK